MARLAGGALIGKVAGRIGNMIVVPVPGGMVSRSLPTYKRPTSPGQAAAAQRMAEASAVWNTLSRAKAEAWNAYAATLTHTNTLTGEPYSPSGYTTFCGLTCRFLQVTPTGSVPTTPPRGDFLPDVLQLGVTGISGGLRFTADAPNRTGVVTELLIERLKNERRKPSGKFKSAAFPAFTGTSPAFDLAVEPGFYAVAYRFVEVATGRATLVAPLGVVQALR